MSEVSSKDKQLILSSRQVNEPAGAEGGLEEELDFLTEILTTRSQDNITVLLLLCSVGGDLVVLAGHVYKVLQSRPACPAHFLLNGQQVDCLIF